MLPFFKILSQNEQKMQQEPMKPKRNKKVDVPVHKHDSKELHRTFSANFNARRHDMVPQKPLSKYYDPGDPSLSVELSENISKISRKQLSKENERLLNENHDFANSQEHLSKKNCKLKEKVSQLQNANEEIANENNFIRTQYEELVSQYTECRNQLELRKTCHSCLELNSLLERSKAEYLNINKTNQELQEDVNMLKNVVYRLNVQLERYQQKISTHKIPKLLKPDAFKESDNLPTVSADNISLNENHYGHSHTPVSWGRVNAHTLGPLLDSYQETIGEKEEIIESYETELSNFTGKLKDIFKENEALHTRLTEDADCSKVLGAQLENLKIDLKSTKDQNDLLIKKCALKQDKIEEILKCYEQKVDQMKRDYAVLHEQFYKSKTDIVALKEKNKNLVDAQEHFNNERSQYIPIVVHTASVNECKKWYEELKMQYENEKTKLKECITNLNGQLNELNNKISVLNMEKNEWESRMKSSDKHIKKAETKFLEAEHTLREVQLSRSACRKQLHKAMNFAKDLVSEQESLLKALNQRQLENKAVKKIGTDIASRMDLLRNQLKTVQKEAWQELSTVEERIQEQDGVITTMKEEHQKEIDRLKEVIKEKDNNLLFRGNNTVPVPHYLLFKDRNMNK